MPAYHALKTLNHKYKAQALKRKTETFGWNESDTVRIRKGML